LSQAIRLEHSTHRLVLTTLAYDTMAVINLSVLLTLRLLSPAAGLYIPPPPRPNLDPATCFEAVVVEPRKIKSMATALISAVNAKQFDVFTIAHGQVNGEYIGELVQNDTTLRSLKERGKLRFLILPFEDLGADRIADPEFSSTDRMPTEADLEHYDQYSRVLKSKEFWKGFECDRILLLQSDSTLCSNSNFDLDHFSMYEYIGGHNGHAGEDHYLPGRRHLNGGFSFRNRLGMLRCIDAADSMTIEMRNWFKKMPEDAFYSNCKELKQPTLGRCKAFAIDNGAYKMDEGFVPFGIHKPWQASGCYGCENDNMRLCGGAVELLWDYNPAYAERITGHSSCCKFQ